MIYSELTIPCFEDDYEEVRDLLISMGYIESTRPEWQRGHNCVITYDDGIFEIAEMADLVDGLTVSLPALRIIAPLNQ